MSVLSAAVLVALATQPAAVEDGRTSWTDEAAATLTKADQLQAQGDWEAAIELYNACLQLSPKPPAFQHYVLYNNIGWSLFHLGRFTEAESNYKLALEKGEDPPPTDHAYINLATIYKAQGRTKAMINAYRHAVQLTNQLPTTAQLGSALMSVSHPPTGPPSALPRRLPASLPTRR